MAIVRHKQPPLRRLMMYGVDHVRQAFASLGELWRNPLASPDDPGGAWRESGAAFLFPRIAEECRSGRGSWQTSSQISLYLRKDLPEQSILDMKQRILLYPEVESVTYMNRDEALREFREISGFGDALDYLDSNPLPPVLSVIPDPRWQNPEGAAELLAKLENEPGIEQGKLDLQWLTRLQGIMNLLRHTITGIAVLLLSAVLLIVGNTLRLNILNQRSEIEVLKLVGATDAFIHRPFLYTGIWFRGHWRHAGLVADRGDGDLERGGGEGAGGALQQQLPSGGDGGVRRLQSHTAGRPAGVDRLLVLGAQAHSRHRTVLINLSAF